MTECMNGYEEPVSVLNMNELLYMDGAENGLDCNARVLNFGV